MLIKAIIIGILFTALNVEATQQWLICPFEEIEATTNDDGSILPKVRRISLVRFRDNLRALLPRLPLTEMPYDCTIVKGDINFATGKAICLVNADAILLTTLTAVPPIGGGCQAITRDQIESHRLPARKPSFNSATGNFSYNDDDTTRIIIDPDGVNIRLVNPSDKENRLRDRE